MTSCGCGWFVVVLLFVVNKKKHLVKKDKFPPVLPTCHISIPHLLGSTNISAPSQ